MQPGQVCRLLLTAPSPCTSSTADTDTESGEIVATVVVVAVRPHAEDRHRLLYYVRCTHLDLSSNLARQRKRAAASSWHGVGLGTIGSGTVHRCNELRVTLTGFVSSDGYHYRYDGWYDAAALQPVEETALSSTIASANASPSAVSASAPRRAVPEEWVAAMERDTVVCEVVYLCYAFQPWFPAAYHALQYLALPEEDVCHSVYLCHRCLSPFFTREQYYVHLEGAYCALRSPPGRLLYHDHDTGIKAFLVDGAKDLHYGRCLSLLGKHFIESKLLSNDVDLYEYVVVTTPRATLPYEAASGLSADDFCAAATHFDAAAWDGDVVMGYFSRLKHRPDHTLSCIATVPIFQRRRVATFLLDLAYWMTSQRQRLCGGPRCCGVAGGAISRPFSPHGQSLLVGYWRRALLRAVDGIAPRRRRASPRTQQEPSFTLAELQAMMDIPIHVQDLEMVLLQSEFTFYTVAEDRSEASHVASDATTTSATRRVRRDGHALPVESPLTSSSSPSPPPASSSVQRYTATMVLEEATLDAAVGRKSKAASRTHAVFKKRWLVRDERGTYAYDLPQLHY